MSKLALCLLAMAVSAEAAPVHLRTNAMTNPLGIDTPRPSFSWMSDDRAADWMQGGYEILVATDAKTLMAGKADVWDSGKVASAESVNVGYAGPGLKAQQKYVWKVLVWDAKGKRGASDAASFETGLMGEWKAQWIGRKDPAAEEELKAIRWIWLPGGDAKHVASGAPAEFRYKLRLEGKPEAASLHVMMRGAFTARVNGTVTGHHDEWSAFDREEVASLLHAGDNEFEFDVTAHRSGEKGIAPAAFAAAIHVTTAGGKEERIVSDGRWEARAKGSAVWTAAKVAGPLSAGFGIGIDRQEVTPGPDRIVTDASLLKKDFSVEGGVRSARLSITALGAYEAILNGMAVAPGTLLAPGWTDFRKRVQYQTYDVTTLVVSGANSVGVMLGGGWYSSPMTWAGVRVTPGPNLLRAQLNLVMMDGTRQTVATDSSWMTASAPVTFSEIYGGESYDARLPGFSGRNWTPAVVGAPADAGMEVTAQPDLPIRMTMVVHPVKLDVASAAHPAVYDMGQNMVGNVRLHVRGPRGTVVKLRYAERLNPDGSIYTENLRNAEATDTYAMSGEGEETWTPAFTFHGFRYVEISYVGGTPAELPTLKTIEGLVMNSLPTTPAVRLVSSSETLNKMNELGAWGQRGNFVSIPTDCPQRDERLGWMGDAGVFWRTGTYNFDIQAFTHKFMMDVTDAQTAEGAFTNVSPNVLGSDPGAPGWGDAGVFVPYAAWLQYGDLGVAEKAWPEMERWMEFIRSHNPDYLRRKALGNNYGDWLAPDEHTPQELIGTAYWALVAREMVEMATAMHRTEDAAKYEKQYGAIAAAYRKAYVKADGSVEGNTQTGYLATIFTGIVEPSMKKEMVARLVKDIDAKGGHLSTGFLGTPFLMFVLDENGHSDLAFKLLLSETYPSWGYMVTKGATTWWERWNGDTGDPGMNSYNHYAFGSVMAWVYRRAAGIDTDAKGAGFHHLTIEPHFDASLPKLHVEYDSDYGTVVSDWKEAERKFTVTLPANVRAEVVLPDGQRGNVGSGVHSWVVR